MSNVNAEIYARYNGRNGRELAAEYRISYVDLVKIIRDMRLIQQPVTFTDVKAALSNRASCQFLLTHPRYFLTLLKRWWKCFRAARRLL